jgi:hypothetical protein
MTSTPDRAHCVATAVVQIVGDDLKAWLAGKPAILTDTHRAVTVDLRDEFRDIERAAIDQYRRSQPD